MRSDFTNQSSLHSAWSNGSISPVVRLKFCAAGGLDRERADSDAVLSWWRSVGILSTKGKHPTAPGRSQRFLKFFINIFSAFMNESFAYFEPSPLSKYPPHHVPCLSNFFQHVLSRSLARTSGRNNLRCAPARPLRPACPSCTNCCNPRRAAKAQPLLLTFLGFQLGIRRHPNTSC